MAACDIVLDAWCDRNCPLALAHGELTALYDGSDHGSSSAWRCYASNTLDAARKRYVGGTTFCTRNAQLQKEQQRCLAPRPPPIAVR